MVTLSAALTFGGVELYVRRSFCRDTRLNSFAEVRHLYLGNPAAVYSLAASDGMVRGLKPNTSTDRASINSLGFRGPEILREKQPGVIRIVCLGGSSVYGTSSSSDSTTWPGWLSELASRDTGYAPLEVLNGGVSGFPARDSVARLEDLFLPLDVDVAVLSNIYNGFVGTRTRYLSIDPKERATRLGQGRFDRLFSYSAVYVRLRVNQAHARREEYYRERINRKQEKADQGTDPPNVQWASWLAERVPEREAWFAREAAGGGDVNPYVLPGDLVVFRKIMERFIGLAREHDVVPVLCTQALRFRLDSDVETYPGGVPLHLLFPNYRNFCEAFSAYNDCLRQLAEEEKVPLFDADALMPRGENYFQDHVHFTDEGCRVYAQGLLYFLRESELLQAR